MARPASLLGVIALLSAAVLGGAVAFDCSLVEVGITPLNDLGPGEYLPGVLGGLYPGGRSTRPASHRAAGVALAATEVRPRNAFGAVDEQDGIIGLISVGMSNVSQEFDGHPLSFKPRADADPATNPRLVIVNGAQDGQTGAVWANPGAPTWNILQQRLFAAGVTSNQVQVVWLKQGELFPGLSSNGFPDHAEFLADHVRQILEILVDRYPNLRLAYLSSRIRAYTDEFDTLNPEPYAYESGFSMRWVIESQLMGDLPYEGPQRVAPWLSWGPYLWADGLVPRSDGFTWQCTDVASDFVHPNPSARRKVADQLLAFFKTDPTTRSWYLRDGSIGAAPVVSVTASTQVGVAPLSVTFEADAFDPNGTISEYAWTFDDGGFAFGADAATVDKTFPVADTYAVQLTVTDDSGNTSTVTLHVVLGAPSPGPWVDLGNILPGANSESHLDGAGTAQPGAPMSLTLTGALPNASAWVLISTAASPTEFAGGLMVPHPGPPALVVRLATDAAGQLGLAAPWPGGIPARTAVYFQMWIEDPSGPFGFAASNAVLLVSP